MPTVRAVLKALSQRLAGVTDTPQFEGEILLTHVLGWNRTQLLTRLDATPDVAPLEALVLRRLAHEPIAYILGEWEFYSLALAVEPPLLVPRPETEHLVDVALAQCIAGTTRVLDLCTGTGCVALAIAHNGAPATIMATDIHPVAIRVASENARKHTLPIDVRQGNLFEALAPETAPFDIIVSNPPYVEAGAWEGLATDIRAYEDPCALLSGDDGLDCIRQIVQEAPQWLKPGGLLAMEMGETQGPAVATLLEARGFQAVEIIRDLAGHARIAKAIWPPG